MNQVQHTRLAMVLIGGARGDLALHHTTGNVHYGIKNHDDGSQTYEANGPILVKLDRTGNEYRFALTSAGAEFLLANLQDCYSERDRKAMVSFASAERRHVSLCL